MTYGLWLSAVGLQTSQYRQAVLANNLANADTVGFKHDVAVIRERPVEADEDGHHRFAHKLLDDLTGGSLVAPTYTAFAQGAIEPTSRPLDVAIDGAGFFTVRAAGQTRYTRDGRFAMDATGRLVMAANGRPVLDANGQEITLITGDGAPPPRIDGQGRIRQGQQVVGRLGLVDFADKQRLRKIGGNLYDANGEPTVNASASLRPEAVERSTLAPVEGLASMIEAARAYQLNATMISLQDEMNGRVVNVANIG